MNHKILSVPALALGLGAGLVAAPAVAGGGAPTTVTIRADGVDLSGTVRSTRPLRCADGRTVIVYRQIGARGGGNDVRFASDTAGLQGGVYRWSTGNTGTEGRFYARVRAIQGCQGDFSKTIRATRPDDLSPA